MASEGTLPVVTKEQTSVPFSSLPRSLLTRSKRHCITTALPGFTLTEFDDLNPGAEVDSSHHAYSDRKPYMFNNVCIGFCRKTSTSIPIWAGMYDKKMIARGYGKTIIMQPINREVATELILTLFRISQLSAQENHPTGVQKHIAVGRASRSALWLSEACRISCMIWIHALPESTH